MFELLKKDKTLRRDAALCLIILFVLIVLCFVLGCASQTTREDSTNYVAQVQQSQWYPCPECGFLIPDKEVSPNVQTENKCPDCREVFFGKPIVESKSNEQQSQAKPYQGPNVLVRGYHHDIKHDGNVEYSFKNSWNVSKDGNSGKMSSTIIRKHENTTKGDYGRTTGPAGLGYSGGF